MQSILPLTVPPCASGSEKNTANIQGGFFLGSFRLERFKKQPLSHMEMLNLLKKRGLHCPDENRVLRHLSHVSYYRLSGYTRNFYQDPSAKEPLFIPGTTYDDVWNLYVFDRELRLLTLDAIERIEVSGRTVLSDQLCVGDANIELPFGSHWFMEDDFYHNKGYKTKFISIIKEETGKSDPLRRNLSTEHYYTCYDYPELPPFWIVAESLSMGKWTYALSKMNQKAQKLISDQYKINSLLFVSWISSIAWTRNVCAHHSILWNRFIKRAPKVPQKQLRLCPDFSNSNTSFFATACICQYFLNNISTNSTWGKRLFELFQKYPSIDISKMGFPAGWYNDSFWRI